MGVWLNFNQKCLREKEGGQEDAHARDMRVHMEIGVGTLNTRYRLESQETETGRSQGHAVSVTRTASSRFSERRCLEK